MSLSDVRYQVQCVRYNDGLNWCLSENKTVKTVNFRQPIVIQIAFSRASEHRRQLMDSSKKSTEKQPPNSTLKDTLTDTWH